ncbi:MAG: bifunctional 3-(3-hydroxy-phenyl)propionate/3-hydroxycinnamic acid hydroxylase [Solirubrobacterales bacterium]
MTERPFPEETDMEPQQRPVLGRGPSDPGRLFDVAIVGMGPVGAILAGLLGRRGVDVIVLERDLEVFPLPRAAHIDHTGLRAVQELGCLAELLPSTIPNPGIEFRAADGDVLMRLPGDQPTWSGVPTSVYFHQPGFDRTLRAAVTALPNVDVHLEAEVVDLAQQPDRVTLRAAKRGNESPVEVNARYVVGCDGATSPIREMLDLELEDLGFHEQWLVVDLLLGEDHAGLPPQAVYMCDPARPHVIIPMPDRRHRIEFMLLPGEEAATMQRPQRVDEVLRKLIGDQPVTVERAAVYTFHGLIAETWRSGRILLAGDAAHQMPPFLGQGMCSGFRDAANLAWKLNRVLEGAPDALLDTYEAERSPHVREVVKRAIDYGAIVGTIDPQAAQERDAAIRADHRSLLFGLPPLLPGPLVLEGGGGLFGQPPVAGVPLDDAVGQRFLVLARHDTALGSTAAWWNEVVGAWVTTLADLPDPDPSLAAWLDAQGVDVAILRPDRYVLGAAPGTLDQFTALVRDLLEGDAESDQVATSSSRMSR